jgi:catechol 2,3-dioxygenase-like lactoylglutathione lyase family enzyme
MADSHSTIALVTLVVDDYDTAIDFFVSGLGFTLTDDVDRGRKRWVVVQPPGGGVSLVLAQASTPEQKVAIGNQTGGRVGFFLHTDDFARDYQRMTAYGILFREEPRHEPYGTVAVFEDQWGNTWDLLERAT